MRFSFVHETPLRLRGRVTTVPVSSCSVALLYNPPQSPQHPGRQVAGGLGSVLGRLSEMHRASPSPGSELCTAATPGEQAALCSALKSSLLQQGPGQDPGS